MVARAAGTGLADTAHPPQGNTVTKISELMTRDVEVIEPDETLQRAAQLMDELNVGALPVCRGTRLVGMITDRDITVRATAAGLSPNNTLVSEVMTEATRSCGASELLRRRRRRAMRTAHRAFAPLGNGTCRARMPSRPGRATLR